MIPHGICSSDVLSDFMDDIPVSVGFGDGTADPYLRKSKSPASGPAVAIELGNFHGSRTLSGKKIHGALVFSSSSNWRDK